MHLKRALKRAFKACITGTSIAYLRRELIDLCLQLQTVEVVVGNKEGEEDSESDDDDVQITIGEIKTESVFNRQPSYQRLQVPPLLGEQSVFTQDYKEKKEDYRIARNFCGPKILRIAVKRPTADNISANYTFNC